ncbi:SLAM family member 5-like, partial [Rhinichthys klamathensis goyatoka]|uniref:SLAM family member 5-like n=1 Tax=Rhinichthys klamathensis goyatoka TaxID=3034132 RepID=UPI0024B4EB95
MIRSAVFLCLCLSLKKGVFGDPAEVKSVSVTEGDSVSLNTDVQVQRDDQILWMFGRNDTRIAEIHRQNISYYDQIEKFKHRLQMDNETGSLTIRNISKAHAGLYKLEIIGSSGSNMKHFNISIYDRLPFPVITSNCSSSSSSSKSRCSLVCSVLNVSDVTLSWYAGISVLSSISVCDLSISLSLPLDVEYQDNNTYSCVINNPVRNQTTHLDITQLCHTCEESSQTPFLLVSLLLLLLLLVVAVLVVLFFCRRRKYTQAKQDGKYYTQQENVYFIAKVVLRNANKS